MKSKSKRYSMKRLMHYHLLLFLMVSSLAQATSEAVSSKTFFMPRPIGSDLALLNASSHDFIFCNEPAPRFFLNMTAFYQDATNHSDLSRYFMPACKRDLVIKGAFAEGDRDISATWLQIAGKNTNPSGVNVPDELGFTLNGATTRGDVELYLNEYSSTIRLSPTFSSYGFLLQSHVNLDQWIKRLWFSVDIPFMQVETATNPFEFDMNNAVTTRSALADFIIKDTSAASDDVKRHERATLEQSLSALEAFNNPRWCYGKIACGTRKLAGFADIQLKLGYDALRFKAFRLHPYVRASVPTSPKPTAQYLFEPVLGNAGHWGVGAGIFTDLAFARGNKFNMAISLGIDYLYVIGADERRSMDLVNNGDWSRYLLVIDTHNEVNPVTRTLYPGINFFTRKVHVKPNHDVNALGSLRMGFGKFFMEAGYNLWVKSAEDVCLKDPLPQGIAIAGTHFGARDPEEAFEIRTFSKATIRSHIASPAASTGIATDAGHTEDNANHPVVLTSADLNTASAAHPKRVSHKIFLSTGLNTTWDENPVRVVFGGSYEFADKNKSLDLWGVYLKVNLFV